MKPYCQYYQICKKGHTCESALTKHIIELANLSDDDIEVYSEDSFPACFVAFFERWR